MMPEGEQAQKAAAFTDIGAELNRGFARVKKWMRTMHYGAVCGASADAVGATECGVAGEPVRVGGA